MTINFNVEPYYDDYDVNDKFHRILYRPGVSVQARELTQMQTILQEQVKRHGDHVFKDGAMVIPGQISMDKEYHYVKLVSTGDIDTYVESLVGRRVTGTSGIEAEVLFATISTETDNATIFVRYVTSGTDTVTKVFASDEVISTIDPENIYPTEYTVTAIGIDPTGIGCGANIQQGIYYVNGFFVLCDEQTIILDKYSNIPSYRIGLDVVETLVTPEDDETLKDNAQGAYNYSAPGAHRYAIDLVLTKLALDSEEDFGFIELIRTEEGLIKSMVRSTEYAVLEQTLARRTFDESGNYTVKPFEMDVREHRDNNRIDWVTNTNYLIGDVASHNGITYVAKNTALSVGVDGPTHLFGNSFDGGGTVGVEWAYDQKPFYNRGINSPNIGDTITTMEESEAKLSIGLEPGKAYIQGFEVEKIATEFIDVSKARATVQNSNSVIPATLGSYVLVDNVHSMPKFDTFDTVDLYNRIPTSAGVPDVGATKIGTARIRGMEWHNGVIGQLDANYKLFIFDVKLNSSVDFNRDVKSVFWDNGTGGATVDFTAQIAPIYSQLIGSVTGAGTTITGSGTSFVTDLKIDDYVLLNETELRRVVSITSQQEFIIDSTATITGATVKRVTTTVHESANSSLLYPLPYNNIKSVRDSIGGNDTNYTVTQRFSGTTTGSGSLTISIISGSGSFASSAESDNYIVIDNSTGDVIVPLLITINAGVNAVLELGGSYPDTPMIVSAAVNKSGGYLTEKTKDINQGTVPFTTETTATAQTLSLGKADCFRIVSVKMKSGTFASQIATPVGGYDIDITDRYSFDNGQRDAFYDVGRILLLGSFMPPTSPIEVSFEYFTHGVGDYFTVNSYSDIPYYEIPWYGESSLSDVFDFRPRIADNGLDFTSGGAVVTAMPKRGIDITTDFSYYLARTDKIAIDFSGKFYSITGIPSLNPGVPLDPSMGMVLYNISLSPYTYGTSEFDVFVEATENKRYTMRDIGKLEKRIDNLEYYTSLSLLEADTESLKITDEFGFDRFKNGFIVDNFSGHSVGNVLSKDYFNSIDMENNELRPFTSLNNINLIEENSNDTQRTIDDYKMWSDVITLPLNTITPHKVLVKQDFASRTEFVNPFAIFTFLGDVNISPSSDDWFETKRAPDIKKNVEGSFNTIKTLAERAGALGTVWNSWQTQWTGTVLGRTFYLNQNAGRARLNRLNGSWHGGGNWSLRGMLVSPSTVTQRQTRTGTLTTLVAKIDTQIVDDRVISSAVIPFIRSRNILVQTKGLKSDTRFYTFFDDVDISKYCTPASKISYTPLTGVFDETYNVGSDSKVVERRINGDTVTCLNKGDVVTNGSGASGVVVGKEYNYDTEVYSLFIQNVKGTFSNGNTITGSGSAATGTITAVSIKTSDSPMTSSANGELHMLFDIPETDAIRFRCGSREFKLVDVNQALGAYTSRGLATYSANGVLETKQATVVSTRNALLVQEQVSDRRTVVSISERVISDTGWYDPLAQTFLVDSRGGAFLSKVDIFFAKKDNKIPVRLEIREVVNGYPGKRVLPFSRVTINPDKVNLSGTSVLVVPEGVSYPKFDTPTTFTFPNPVYVQDSTEYCVVLLSDSDNYKVWISQMGDTIPESSRRISEQPYAGVLFKSQNGTAWTADQTQDLKFTIHRANFDTSLTSNVKLVNDAVPFSRIEYNPFQMSAASNVIRVWHLEHGMSPGSKVILDNTDTADINGVPYAEIYGPTHTISNVDYDSYTITVGTNATETGYHGGITVRATNNIQFDNIQPQVQIQTFSDTTTDFILNLTSGKSVDGAQTPYILSNFSDPNVLVNENNPIFSPAMVASEINETDFLGGNKSLSMVVQMTTTNEALSPAIDTHRLSAILTGNKVNNPFESTTNVPSLDNLDVFSGATGAFDFNGDTITSLDTSVGGVIESMGGIVVGQYIGITGSTFNNGAYLVTGVHQEFDPLTGIITCEGANFDTENTSVATVTTRALFKDEITAEGSSTISKYVSNTISLSQPSTYLRVKFAANIPAESNVELYYKTPVIGSLVDINTIKWELLTPDSNIIKVELGNEEFFDIDYSKKDIPQFDTIVVKIVMKSTNTSAVPRLKDLRIIACA